MENVRSSIPMRVPLNPGHDILLPTPDPPVLDVFHHNKNSKFPPIWSLFTSSPRPESRLSENSESSNSEGRYLKSNLPTYKTKRSRPFRAYPRVPMPITFMGASGGMSTTDSAEAYEKYKEQMLSQVQLIHSGINTNMRRTKSQNSHIKDPAYWEMRKKNNEAAKRSRDARRAKEDEIAIRCSFLEQENMKLKIENAALKESLRFEMYGMMVWAKLATPRMENVASSVPMRLPLNPVHGISLPTPDPPVRDLCVSNNSASPDYPHDYKNSKF